MSNIQDNSTPEESKNCKKRTDDTQNQSSSDLDTDKSYATLARRTNENYIKLDKALKEILDNHVVSKDTVLDLISKNYRRFYKSNYRDFKEIFQKYDIDGKAFFQNVYMNADEDVKYQMWKDGYVDSCPARLLVYDLIFQNTDVLNLVQDKYNVNPPYCDAIFSHIEKTIKDILYKASKSLKIAMAWFTNYDLFKAVLHACRRGVEVQLIINNDQINNGPNGLPFDDLIQLGAKIYIPEQHYLIHQKFCIVDDTFVINGSYNWTNAAEGGNNNENIVIMQNGEVINTFIREFDWLVRHNFLIDFMPPPVIQDYQEREF